MCQRKGGSSRWHGEITTNETDEVIELNLVEILDFDHFCYVEYIRWLGEEALKWEMCEMESGIG
jgi:hypothetical protein